MRHMGVTGAVIVGFCLVACDGGTPSNPADTVEETQDTDAILETTTDARTPLTPPTLRVVTFNTGTSLKPQGGAADRGYGAEQWEICDEWYGNGLSWHSIMDDARAWIAEVDPQSASLNINWTGECTERDSGVRRRLLTNRWPRKGSSYPDSCRVAFSIAIFL